MGLGHGLAREEREHPAAPGRAHPPRALPIAQHVEDRLQLFVGALAEHDAAADAAHGDGEHGRRDAASRGERLRRHAGSLDQAVQAVKEGAYDYINKPFKIDEVREAIANLGVQGVTVTEVHGFGRQRGHLETYRGAEYRVDFIPKTKVEIIVDDAICEQVVEAISNIARTGKVGDGKIFVGSLSQSLRIRTGETGVDSV